MCFSHKAGAEIQHLFVNADYRNGVLVLSCERIWEIEKVAGRARADSINEHVEMLQPINAPITPLITAPAQ